MECPNCGQPVEPEAAFCGNCGQPLKAEASPFAQALRHGASPIEATNFGRLATHGAVFAAPSYALAKSHTHNHVKVILAIVFGVLGLAGSLLIPLSGIVLGIAGLVLATMATRASGRSLKIIGLVLSCLALLAGLAVWVYVAAHNPRLHPNEAQTAAAAKPAGEAITAIGLSTPCYSLKFPGQINIENTSGSCQMDAFNGTTIDNSSNVYKVLSSGTTTVTEANFAPLAKKAIENDIAENLPGFSVSSEGSGVFASSAAYFVNAADESNNEAMEEAAVLHSSADGATIFVLVHITFGTSTNLSLLEKDWQWK